MSFALKIIKKLLTIYLFFYSLWYFSIVESLSLVHQNRQEEVSSKGTLFKIAAIPYNLATMIKKHIFLHLLLSLALFSTAESAYLYKNGKLTDTKEVAEFPLEQHFELGMQALQKKDWPEAMQQFRIVTINFPDADLGQEGFYFLGVAYYHMGDPDLANKNLTIYLQKPKSQKYFIETFRYKLAIADDFKNGARKHLFGQAKLPKCFSDKNAAIDIYNEVSNSLPTHELAAKALFSKAALLLSLSDFKGSIEAYQAIIKKFPKTTLASQSYVKIAETLLEESKVEFQNPDLLASAQINLKKFSQDFPKAEAQLQTVKDALMTMHEVYAQGLYETGRFYERKKMPTAAVLYYTQAVKQFPDTQVAKVCTKRLQTLDKHVKEMKLSTHE
ncbi:MAG: hypothetical protein JWO53_1132 [Chlamydiia bacterium]|nr:hypothetical protein [Chlamydiia bacterium]